jgi:MinD-like ATPase involved in chromosome partitioning or flagellar assembly
VAAVPQGSIWTFYSYKGGVGRSLALANVSVQLASWGYRVLCVDWDLEAPGLHLYFERYLPRRKLPGIVDLVRSHVDGEKADWRDCRTEVGISELSGSLDFLPAGEVDIVEARQLDPAYVRRVQGLDWERLYAEGLGSYVELLRTEWKSDYDFVLIDSRTGITDIGGICTVQLPDFLAVMFTANSQSVLGALEVARRAGEATGLLPFDRPRPPTLPIVSRFESNTEVDLAKKWLRDIDEQISDIVAAWLDRAITVEALLNHIKVPYVARWSFGEQLPVRDEGTSDPLSVGYAFETIAALVAHGLEHSALLASSRSAYVDAAARSGSPGKLAKDDYDFDVLVSYDRTETNYARDLMRALANKGLRVWSDIDEIATGTDMRASVTDGPARSRNMVTLVGDEPTRWMESEYRQFLLNSLSSDAGRLFIPVLRTPKARSSGDLAQYRSIDASRQSPEELANELHGILLHGWASRDEPVDQEEPLRPHLLPAEAENVGLARLIDGSELHKRKAHQIRARLRFLRLYQLFFLLASLLTVGVAVSLNQSRILWLLLAASLFFATVIIESVLRGLHFDKRLTIHKQTSSELDRERVFFESSTGAYSHTDDPGRMLTERVESILFEADRALEQHEGFFG